jgi:putative addiction module killer protein
VWILTDTAIPREVIIYSIEGNDRKPFNEWLYGLRDCKGRRCILMYIRKLEQNTYDNYEPLREGVSELRIFYGPGYRIYFGRHGDKIVILLGSDKDRQEKVLQKAIDYWRDYKLCEKRKYTRKK